MKHLFNLLLVLLCMEVSAQISPVKISHAEPLYVDFIRDLGARKGEKEWNAGWGMADGKNYRYNFGFAEYEFALLNRLGMEVEIPFSFYSGTYTNSKSPNPESKIEGIKLAMQYTFLVSPKYNTTMAIGYIQEFKLHSFRRMKDSNYYMAGYLSNPVFIVAKKWGEHVHMNIYSGILIEPFVKDKNEKLSYEINSSFFYRCNKIRKTVGLEINQELIGENLYTVFRPQVKTALAKTISLGVLAGVPTNKEQESWSFMFRIIYEPVQKR